MNFNKTVKLLTIALSLSGCLSAVAAPIIEGEPDNAGNTALAQNNAGPSAAMQVESNADPDSLINTVTQLQQQVRDLQGQLELQSHQIDQLTQAQKNIYLQLSEKSPTNVAVDTAATALTTVTVNTATPKVTPPSPAAAGVSVKPTATAPVAAPVAANNNDAQQKDIYDHAYQAITKQQYSDANIEMTDYLTQYPHGTYAANAHYWLGEMGLVSGDLKGSQSHFQAVVDQFADSPKVPDADLKLGYIYYQEGKWAMARETLQSLVQQYPNTSAASLATQRLQDMTRQGV